MKFLKKYYKLIGTLITVVAFVFVIKKIVTMDVDWSMFASGKPLGIIAGCVLVQTAIIFFMSTPWVQFVRILSGKKIAMKDALPVYTKCNLMKYVPGNVFQYVGRNQLAADLHISQALLSHYENGAREPGLNFVCRACDYYGVTADYLLGRTEENGKMVRAAAFRDLAEELRVLAEKAEAVAQEG